MLKYNTSLKRSSIKLKLLRNSLDEICFVWKKASLRHRLFDSIK